MNRRYQLRGVLRLLIFGLVLFALLMFGSLNLIETDLLSGVTVREMAERSDIEIAFVGSSVAVYHFNPEIILEECGLVSYNSAVLSSSLQGDTALTEELFRNNHPKYIVLVLEPYNLDTAKESAEAEYRMMPFLSDIGTMIRYYRATTKLDADYINRLFVMRAMYPQSFEGILKTIRTRQDPSAALAEYAYRVDPSETYMGSGFIRHHSNRSMIKDDIRIKMYREKSIGDYYPLLPDTIDLLTEYRELVESHGAQLIFAICPNHTSHLFAEPSFMPYIQSLLNYAREIGVPCFNFQYAKPELMPCLDEYFFDIFHMDGEGADELTKAFCKVFNAWQSGEDISELFYYNSWLYEDSLHTITNTWVWPDGENHYLADANIDFHSTAVYRFVYRTPDGEETLLRDYSTDPEIDFELPETGCLRVYARLSDMPQDPDIYYDYPNDYVLSQLLFKKE